MLIAGLLADDVLVRADAARLLGLTGRKEAVAPLAAYVAECRHCTKTAGIEALARIGDRSVCGVLRRIAEWPNVPDDWYWFFHRGVRAAACVALLSLGDDAGAGYLGELADRKHDVFYAWFAPAILRLKRRSPAVTALKARLTVEALTGEGAGRTRFTNPGTAAMVAEALGLINSDEARTHLRKLAQHQSRYVRAAAAVALVSGGGRRAEREFVAEMAERDRTDFVRIKAAYALAQAGEHNRAQALARFAGSVEDPFDLATTVDALGQLGRREFLPHVRKHLNHQDPYVRQRCVEAMERLGASVRDARKKLNDPDQRVRLSAAQFLVLREARKG
mgnify:CR=1 FL=1